MVVSGGKIIDVCGYCGKWVTLNKWCGGLHICLTDRERQEMDRHNQIYAQQVQAQQQGQVSGLRKLLAAQPQPGEPITLSKPRKKRVK